MPGVVQPRGRPRLALRARSAGSSPSRGIDLDGHLALELLVVGEPDDAEAAGADPAARAGSGRARGRPPAAASRRVSRPGAGCAVSAAQLIGRDGSFHGNFGFRARGGPTCPAWRTALPKDARQSAGKRHTSASLSFLDERDDPPRAPDRRPPAAARPVDGPPDPARTPADRGRRRPARRGPALPRHQGLPRVAEGAGIQGLRARRRELVAESDQQSTQLFELLDNPGSSEVDFTVNVNGAKVTADSSWTVPRTPTSRTS